MVSTNLLTRLLFTEFNKAAACFEELQFSVIYTKILELTLKIHSQNSLSYGGTDEYAVKTV